MSPSLTSLALALISLQKGLIDIFEVTEKYKSHMETVLIRLKNPKLIKLIGSYLSSNANDIRSIGKIILANNKIFSSFNVLERNKLIIGQDIVYVMK